ncbi:MAG TPA: sigma-70 family RNA polymerase sigma factor [Pyrinomonadaceae bacterium]
MLADELSTYVGTPINNSEALIERARRGDVEAFNSLFERYADPIFSFIYRMVGQHELAEDLTQETFVRAYRKLKGLQLHAGTKLSTWLFSIAKNVARESMRARLRDSGRVEITEQSVLELSDNAPRPDAQLLDRELNSIIQAALQTLDEDKRLVFTLRVIQQRSYEEIAEITEFSLPKIKTDIFRARAEMRRLLHPYLEASDEM